MVKKITFLNVYLLSLCVTQNLLEGGVRDSFKIYKP